MKDSEIASHKNIVFVIPSLDYGGAETMLIHQINYLHEKGYQIRLIIMGRSTEYALIDQLQISEKSILQLGLPVQILTFRAIRYTFLKGLVISKYLKKWQASVVIANLPLAHFQMRVVKLLDRLKGRRYQLVNYHHSLQYAANPLDTFPKRIFNSINSFLARITDDKSIFISDAVRKNVTSHFFINKNSVVIPNAIPERNINEKEGLNYLKKVGVDLDTYKILVLPGRIHTVKGHYFFLDAYRKLIDQNPLIGSKFKVIIAGGGLYHEHFENLVHQYGLANNLIISGVIRNNLLLSLFKLAYLVVIPSLSEGFGNVAIEGLMQQSRMLVSDAGGLDEIIVHKYNGYKFNSNDSKDFITKLEYLLSENCKFCPDTEVLIASFRKNYTLPAQMVQITEFLR
ncbi:glycosyltransferase family 4 protein [Catalinimonas sp. 4WD22]|uniref:glycosyltransferase family 4 protein n=1 Tax=Catalinimonas locisalis TaxID=3133978 RepID=UPI00310126A3